MYFYQSKIYLKIRGTQNVFPLSSIDDFLYSFKTKWHHVKIYCALYKAALTLNKLRNLEFYSAYDLFY